jgi:hypothetical protein
MSEHTAEIDALIEERRRDHLTAVERAARDFTWDYRWWQEGLWRVLNRRDPAYRTGPVDEATAKYEAASWGGDYYAAPIERPHLPTRVIPPDERREA